MKTIGYRRDGRLTWFGRQWHLSTGRLIRVRYWIGRVVERVIPYEDDPQYQNAFCRWLGLSGYQRLD